MNPRRVPPGLGPKWVRSYTDFLLAAVGLRHLLRAGCPTGQVQDVLTAKINSLLELADRLNALGRCPVARIAGEEAALWRQATVYAAATEGGFNASLAGGYDAAVRVQAAWDRFCEFVRNLGEDAFRSAAVLDPAYLTPGRLTHLFGPCLRSPGSAEEVDQTPGEDSDEPVSVG